ncbi:BPTI/Kunitz domain-containing protein-like [Halichondria panicea]|uniref:BPTI/Kunitz domain-containing protein-like n=1 Tax=Halichondria panicea TaxID=6063 RepID=UPI00312B4E54
MRNLSILFLLAAVCAVLVYCEESEDQATAVSSWFRRPNICRLVRCKSPRCPHPKRGRCCSYCPKKQGICHLPKVTGLCKAYFPRYYFSKKSGECEKFIYGGCGGNANNFKTLQQCQQKCGICNLPKVTGHCKASLPRYHFCKKSGHCEKFIYGGCGGNANNFKTLQQCQQKCGARGKC